MPIDSPLMPGATFFQRLVPLFGDRQAVFGLGPRRRVEGKLLSQFFAQGRQGQFFRPGALEGLL